MPLTQDDQLTEIRHLRNKLTHSWMAPFISSMSGEFLLPRRVRNDDAYRWPYDELEQMMDRYEDWVPVLPMMATDLDFIEALQSQVFERLVRDVSTFERNYGVEIR